MSATQCAGPSGQVKRSVIRGAAQDTPETSPRLPDDFDGPIIPYVFEKIGVGEGARTFEADLDLGEVTLACLVVREKPQNLFPMKLICNLKRSNFENRTESVESRASERNWPFGE
jgi:hypothetical protein